MDGARAAPRRERAALLGWGQVGAAASREPAVVRLQGAWLPGARTLLARQDPDVCSVWERD